MKEITNDGYTICKNVLEINLLRFRNLIPNLLIIAVLANCGLPNLLNGKPDTAKEPSTATNGSNEMTVGDSSLNGSNEMTIGDNGLFDLFTNRNNDSETILKVNRYIWKASLEVLNFLPLEAVDPFSGIIQTGWGTAPGSNTLYRATIYIQDPSLDARSLEISLFTKTGPASANTIRIIEDAILSRAIQLRLNDEKL